MGCGAAKRDPNRREMPMINLSCAHTKHNLREKPSSSFKNPTKDAGGRWRVYRRKGVWWRGKEKKFYFLFWELQKIFFFFSYFGPVVRLSWDWRVVRIHVWHGSTGP
jgi:hypothetical protein